MPNERGYAQSVYVKTQNKVVVCGGFHKGFDVYDIAKDVWHEYGDSFNYHHSAPAVWNHPLNPDIIYVCGDVSESNRGNRFGCIEWFDLRTHSSNQKCVGYYNSMETILGRSKIKISAAAESRAMLI
eukprot:115629_1